jgi:methionyl-tRNA synthetase
VHVIGKGIVRFHAVYWLGILLSAGLPLPTDLLVHGHLTVEGRKIGKSLGNAIDPDALVARHGAEAVRYFLLRRIRPFEDSDFHETRLRAAVEGDLADQLGNLVRRTTALVQRAFGGQAPRPGASHPLDDHLRDTLGQLPGRLHAALDGFTSDEALTAVFDSVAATNRYLEEAAPWRTLAGGDVARSATVLAHALEAIRIVAAALAPFLPGTSAAILAQLGQEPARDGLWEASLRWRDAAWDHAVPGGPVLFAKEAAAPRAPG